MTEHRNHLQASFVLCLAGILFSISLAATRQEPDVFFYASLRNHFTVNSGGSIDPPKNWRGAVIWYGDNPEVEAILVNETKRTLTVHWATANIVSPVLLKSPSGELGSKLRVQSLQEYPTQISGQERTDVRSNSVVLKPNDQVKVAFRIVTETDEKPPTGDYEIQVICKITAEGLTKEWAFQNKLEFEIREPQTLPERISFLADRAMEHLGKQNHVAAEEAIQQAIQLYPFFSHGYTILANIKERQGQYSEAVKYHQKAVQVVETRQDYLATKNESNASIEEWVRKKRATIRDLQVKMASQQKKP